MATVMLVCLSSLGIKGCKKPDPASEGLTEPQEIALDRALLESTNIPTSWYSSIDDMGKFIYYHPPSAGTPASRVLVVFGAQGAAFHAAKGYAPIAKDLGLFVVAVQHRRHDNDDRPYYYYVLGVIDKFMKEGAIDQDPDVVLVGFSGGGKMTMAVGVYEAGIYFDAVLAP